MSPGHAAPALELIPAPCCCRCRSEPSVPPGTALSPFQRGRISPVPQSEARAIVQVPRPRRLLGSALRLLPIVDKWAVTAGACLPRSWLCRGRCLPAEPVRCLLQHGLCRFQSRHLCLQELPSRQPGATIQCPAPEGIPRDPHPDPHQSRIFAHISRSAPGIPRPPNLAAARAQVGRRRR